VKKWKRKGRKEKNWKMKKGKNRRKERRRTLRRENGQGGLLWYTGNQHRKALYYVTKRMPYENGRRYIDWYPLQKECTNA
jgi:hypothetical protein